MACDHDILGKHKRTPSVTSQTSNTSVCAQDTKSTRMDIGWHNAEKLGQLISSTKRPNDCCGTKVVFYKDQSEADLGQSTNSVFSDHSDVHNQDWARAIDHKCLESGTITNLSIGPEDDIPRVTVTWDCGETRIYPCDQNGEWTFLRVYSLGPAGYLGQMVFCDKCLSPSRGLAFRLARKNIRVGDLYDLCYMCYNKSDDEHVPSGFHCNMPSGNVDRCEQEKKSLTPRKEAKKFKIAGIFKGAKVSYPNSPATCGDHPTLETESAHCHGDVLSIVHKKGNYDLRKTTHYDSCAEIVPDVSSTGSHKTLVYKEAGTAGKVELKALKPGTAPSEIPVEHYPALDTAFIEEMFSYKDKLVKMNESDGDYDCFMRFKPNGKCYSLTISGTRLTKITDSSIWERCEDLKIVILLMNELESLPQELEGFSESIDLVCIQHNNFSEIPKILFKLPHIKHLNLHGNKISVFSSEMSDLKELERLKFGTNKLYSLPNIFSSFRHLTEITLNDNFLTRLPQSFSSLRSLESIDLSNNSFTSIPTPLLYLPKLQYLYLEWNRIQRLTPIDGDKDITFDFIGRLGSLKLKGNPIHLNLDPQGRDCESLEVLKDREKFSSLHGNQPTKALRVLVLGRCGSGKTSIVQSLGFDKYVTPTSEAHHDHTVGIERYSIPVQMTTRFGQDVIVELRVWDFAGERSYVMMNDLFLTGGTLVWIAVDFQSYDCTDASFQETIASWLQQVMTKTIRPVVWIIGTRTDKCTPEQVPMKKKHIIDTINKQCQLFKRKIEKELGKLEMTDSTRNYRNRSPACVRKNIKDLRSLKKSNVPCFLNNHLKVIPLTNTHTFKGFELLKHEVKTCLQNEPFFGLAEPLQTVQLAAADKLRSKTEEKLSAGEAPILEKEEVIKILKSDKFDEHDAELFLDYLCKTGEVLQSVTNSIVILDVDWLINLLKQVFHHDFATMVNERKNTAAFLGINKKDIKKDVETQQEKGIVSDTLLEALWPPLQHDIFHAVTELLGLFGLAYKTDTPSSGYLFPWLVKDEFSESMLPDYTSPKSHIVVSYDFSPFLPTCFIQQLAVNCKKHFPITAVYKNAFVIDDTKCKDGAICAFFKGAVAISLEDDRMCGKVNICVQQTDGTAMRDVLWSMVMGIVREIEKVLCHWPLYSTLLRKVYCPECTDGFWDLQYLKNKTYAQRDSFQCSECGQQFPAELIIPPDKYKINSYVDELSSSLNTSLNVSSQFSRSLSNPIPAPTQPTDIPMRHFYSQQQTHSFPSAHPQLPGGVVAQRNYVPVLVQPHPDYPLIPCSFPFPNIQPAPGAVTRSRDSQHLRTHYSDGAIQEESGDQFEMDDDMNVGDQEQIQPGASFPVQCTELQHSDSPSSIPIDMSYAVHRARHSKRRLNKQDILTLAENVSADTNWQNLLSNLGMSQEPNIEGTIMDNAGRFPKYRNELIFQVLYEWMKRHPSTATVAALANVVVSSGKEAAWTEAFKLLLRTQQ